MIILTFTALAISGGSIPVFIGILITYDLIIIAAFNRRRILKAFKIKE